ncbi:biotin--[acetyl-CoA-carboxylase] ligase [Sporocytophaga myxococcoides]|uniref:biotin--[acetyl-CoA-carboxylase] ligase n=1 Tax=Sporocytophaga myxococcoides TaxID=153721 RepID=UPI0004917C07|nr:biotin--[acetyl-CoA-carboxylase] ligase [Sporocytophaga myxococcoides]
MYNITANTLFIGKPLIYLPSCHSTNDIAAEMVQSPNITEGTTIIANFQTAGKGQRGNSWESQEGKNLMFSIILKPSFLSPTEQFQLNITISLSVSEFLTTYLGKKIKVKWPNDIFFEDKKICGILIQNFIKSSKIETSVVGIGININQIEFSEGKATSLARALEKEFDRNILLNEFLVILERNYLQLRTGRIENLKSRYIENLYKRGETGFYKTKENVLKGMIIGVDGIGQLLIKENENIHSFQFKEVEFLNFIDK